MRKDAFTCMSFLHTGLFHCFGVCFFLFSFDMFLVSIKWVWLFICLYITLYKKHGCRCLLLILVYSSWLCVFWIVKANLLKGEAWFLFTESFETFGPWGKASQMVFVLKVAKFEGLVVYLFKWICRKS